MGQKLSYRFANHLGIASGCLTIAIPIPAIYSIIPYSTYSRYGLPYMLEIENCLLGPTDKELPFLIKTFNCIHRFLCNDLAFRKQILQRTLLGRGHAQSICVLDVRPHLAVCTVVGLCMNMSVTCQKLIDRDCKDQVPSGGSHSSGPESLFC
jgi:hypothetical protein